MHMPVRNGKKKLGNIQKKRTEVTATESLSFGNPGFTLFLFVCLFFNEEPSLLYHKWELSQRTPAVQPSPALSQPCDSKLTGHSLPKIRIQSLEGYVLPHSQVLHLFRMKLMSKFYLQTEISRI